MISPAGYPTTLSYATIDFFMKLTTQLSTLVSGKPFARPGWLAVLALVVVAGMERLPAASPLFDVHIPAEKRPHFAKPPEDAELRKVPLFLEPLAPMEQPSVEGENKALARALEAFSARTIKGDTSTLEKFVETFPKSRWNAALFLNMGLYQYNSGAFSQALHSFEKAWELSKSAKNRPATFIRDRAAAEAGRMNARLGNRAWLDKFLPETEGMDISGTAGEILTNTREATFIMHNSPEKGFMCGPYALLNILPQDIPADVREAIRRPQSTDQGTSLALVLNLSKKTGQEYQAAYREPGAETIVPCVVHWSVGHFAALVSKKEGGVISRDPTFGDEILISNSVLDREASGYFLVPAGPLPSGWRKVGAEEAATIWGKGVTNGKDEDETRNCSEKSKSDGCSTPMASYNIHAMLVSLTISDTPVRYTPAYGPPVTFKVTYNQRDVAQPDSKSYSNLGPKWSHNWLSYIIPGSWSATVVERGGGSVNFDGLNIVTGLFSFDQLTASTLKGPWVGGSQAGFRYERTFADGSKQIFDTPFGPLGSEYIMLTKIVDPQGYETTLSYDTNARLTGITDAAGNTTHLSYEDGSDYKIKTVTDPFNRTAYFSYDALGRLESITDPELIVSQFSYEGNGTFINALTTPYGTTWFFKGESEQDRWLEIYDPEGNTERVEYRGTTPHIGYGESDPIGTIPAGTDTNFLIYRNTFFWDKKAYAEGRGDYTKAHIFHWLHSANNQTAGVLESEKDPYESRVCYLYQGQTNPIYVNPEMFSQRPFRILRKLNTGTDPESTQEYKYEFDNEGHLVNAIDPAGRETSYTYYPSSDHLHFIKQANGSTDEQLLNLTYSGDLLHTVTDAAGQTTTINHNANGQIETLVNPLSKTTTWHYDSQGRLEYVDGPLAGNSDKTSYTYDPVVLTRVKTITDPDGTTRTYDFDNIDRITKVTYPDGTYEQTIYNRLDPEWSRDRMGRWTRYWYNSLRRLVAVMDPAGRIVEYDGCDCGDHSIVDGNGEKTVWEKDVAGRLLYKKYPDGSKDQYFYDLAGRLDHMVDTANRTRTYTYEVDNNLESLTYPAGASTASISFTYGSTYNRMETMTDPTGVTTFGYNPITNTPALGAGQLASVDGPLANDTIIYEYDELGRVDHRAINGTASDTIYDDLNRATQVVNALGQFDYTYDGPTNRLETATAPNGVVSTFAYFSLPHDQVLQTISHTGPGSTAISSFGYEYDAAGNIKNWIQTQASNTVLPTADWKLAMDGSNQLTGISVTGQPALAEAFGYDNGGNRLTRQKGNQVSSSSYNELNQLVSSSGGGKLRFSGTTSEPANVTVQGKTARMLSATNFFATPDVSVGTNTLPVIATDGSGNSRTNNYQVVVPAAAARSFSYDDAGNMLNDAIRTYEWDGLNRLVKITLGTDVYEFAYDGFSRRVSEKKNGTLTKRFVWDGLTLAEERDANNVVTKRFFPQGEQKISNSPFQISNYYYARDHLGSVREVTDATGATVAGYSYDAWGKRTLLAGTDLATFGYTGHYSHPEVNLVFAPFRVYDPETGRWPSRDPLDNAEMLQGPNLYAYVANDPINLWDPLGEQMDSVSASLTNAIVAGDSAAIESALTAGEGVLSECQVAAGRAAIARLRSTAGELIRGSLKRSSSYHSELAEKTYEEILKDSSKAAKQMKKLIEQSKRLMEKCS